MTGIVTSGLPLTNGVWLGWAGGMTLKVSALLAVTGLLMVALARSSAALRHLLWSLAITGVLVLPAVSLAVPWSWEVLPELGSVAAGERTSVGGEAGHAEAGLDEAASPEGPAHSIGAAGPNDAPGPRARQVIRVPGARDGTPVRTTDGAPSPTSPSEPASFPFGSLILLGWAVVALLLLLHQAAGWAALRRITREAEAVDDPALRWELAWTACVSRTVRLLRSESVRVPLTWGVRRPVVLLPRESRDWAADRLRLVLHHELAHVRRLDALTETLARVACALHWYNPLVWWAAARLRAESEQAADDTVLRGGARASDYAGHLLEIVAHLGSRRAPAGALPLAQRSGFEGRVLAILDPTRQRGGVRRVSAAALGTALVAAVVALGSVTPAQAATESTADVVDVKDVGEAALGGAREAVVDASEGAVDDASEAAVGGSLEAHPTAEPVGDGVPAPSSPGVGEGATRAPSIPARGDAGHRTGGPDPGPRELSPKPDQPTARVVDTTSVRALTQALQSDTDAEVRRTAAWALGQLEDPSATTALVQALRGDASAEVRRMAAWAMGQIEDPSAAEALGEALADEDPEVRETALWALGQIESPEAVGPLTRALSDPDPGVRKTAAWALGQIESREAVAPLAAAIDDEDADVRARVVWALGQIESAEAVEALSGALNDEEPDVRRQAAWALGQIEAESAVPSLAAALSDPDDEVARMAAWALGQIEPSSAPPELIEAARRGTGERRTTALWALVQIEDPAAVPALVEALQDGNAEVRARALRGLAQIGSSTAVEAIAELLQDPDPEVRAAAARALAGGRGGGDPRPNPNPSLDPRPRPNGR